MTRKPFSLTRRRGLAALAAAATVGWGTSAHAGAKPQGKAIVIVYSRTGSTLGLAQAVREATGADFLQLEVKKPYAEAYYDMTDIARAEKRSGARRELATVIPDLSAYDTVWLGSAFWWGGLAVPMWTFLSDHDLAGKTVHPFIVSGSSPASGAIAELRRLCPKADITPEFHATSSTLGTARRDILDWVKASQKAARK